MSTLITGGAGFIGYHLCKKKLEEGQTVICVDNLHSGQSDNINLLMTYTNFSFYNINIIFPFNIQEDIAEIYHLACPASPKYYQEDDLYTLDTCYKGTENVLNLALKKNSKVLFTSTSEIYGEPLEHPQNEEYRGNVNTFGPRSCYDEGKRVAESLMYAYKKLGVNIRIVRIFNTYGPNMRINDGRVVTNFISQALSNQPLTIYGDGSQTRSFCYVDNLVDGLIKLMDSDYDKPLNLGNPAETTIKELAEIIKELTNSESEIIYKEIPIDDPTRRKPDITKATNILNWYPTTDLTQGLIHTIFYYMNNT
jgi:UDP-glucuronate decarboxylase